MRADVGEWLSLFFLIPTISTSPWPAAMEEEPLMGRVWGEESWERPGDQKEPEGWPLSTASRNGMWDQLFQARSRSVSARLPGPIAFLRAQ